MDIDEWEILPMEGLNEFREGGDPDKKIFPQKFMGSYYDHKGVLDMDYFSCSLSNPKVPKQLVPMSIHLDLPIERAGNWETLLEPAGKDDPLRITPRAMDPEQEGMVSQVFFKKMKENEFVDMKMDSPRPTSPTSRGVVIPQVDAGNFQYDDGDENLVSACFPRKKPWKQQHDVDCDSAEEEGVAWEGSKGGINIWKWSLNGVGALCSFGFAAATICIFIVGSSHQNKNQKIQLQIYTDDKVTSGNTLTCPGDDHSSQYLLLTPSLRCLSRLKSQEDEAGGSTCNGGNISSERFPNHKGTQHMWRVLWRTLTDTR